MAAPAKFVVAVEPADHVHPGTRLLITSSDRLHGSDEQPGAEWLTPLPPDGLLISPGYTGSSIRVRIERWTGRPPTLSGHETFATASLLLLRSGWIEVGDTPAVQVPIGNYSVCVTGWKRGVHGENYLLQLWPQNELPPAPARPAGAATWLTDADHHLFWLADEEFRDDLDVLPGEGEWLGVNPHALAISVICEGPYKKVRLELWDTVPPQPGPGYEVRETCAWHLVSGHIELGNPAGGEPGTFHVPPGHYNVAICAWDRTGTARQYREIGERTGFDDTNPEFAAALEDLTGKERYLVQLWPAE